MLALSGVIPAPFVCSVIPAQAGIQKSLLPHWIPAGVYPRGGGGGNDNEESAGMTMGGSRKI